MVAKLYSNMGVVQDYANEKKSQCGTNTLEFYGRDLRERRPR
jgi:hypothetical protein